MVADAASRVRESPHDWQLNPVEFQRIQRHWKCSIDGMADTSNRQLQRFVSFHPLQEARYHDFFRAPLHEETVWLFPPTSMVGKVVDHCRRQHLRAVVVTPLWPRQVWFNQLLRLTREMPAFIKASPRLLLARESPYYHQPRTDLLAWHLSGNAEDGSDCPRWISKYFSKSTSAHPRGKPAHSQDRWKGILPATYNSSSNPTPEGVKTFWPLLSPARFWGHTPDNR